MCWNCRADQATAVLQHLVRHQGERIEGPNLVCIDLQSNSTTQAPRRSGKLDVGDFHSFHCVY